jgi:hypothetical protein
MEKARRRRVPLRELLGQRELRTAAAEAAHDDGRPDLPHERGAALYVAALHGGSFVVLERFGTYAEHFGVEAVTVFNMTELCTPLVSEVNPTARGTTGLRRARYLLRSAGVTADAWDREKAGIVVKGDRLGARASGEAGT